MKTLIVAFCIGFLLTGCNPAVAPASSSIVPPPTATPAVRKSVNSTPTEIQLPHNLVTESAEYCKPPYAFLPVEDGNDISEAEIATKLLEIWLRRYKAPNAHPYCRIDGYTIDKVYDDPSVYSQPLEPRGDFMRVVIFAVKLIQIPTDWMSFSGELDQENWLHLHQVMAISKTNGGYKMQFAYP